MLSLILLALFAFPVVFCAPPHPQMLSTAVNETTSLDTSAGTKVSAAWYAGWHSEQFPLSKVSWKDYTHMTYAFASVLSLFLPCFADYWTFSSVTTPDVKKITVDDETNLHDFVTTAKSKVGSLYCFYIISFIVYYIRVSNLYYRLGVGQDRSGFLLMLVPRKTELLSSKLSQTTPKISTSTA